MRRRSRWVALVMSVGVLIGLWSSLFESQLLWVRKTSLTGLPAGAEPVRLAAISAFHICQA